MARNSDTRTITQKKVYRDYRLTMAIDIDQDYSGKNWLDIVNESQDRIDAFRKTVEKNSKQYLMARDRLPRAIFDGSIEQITSSPRTYLEMQNIKFVLEDVEIAVHEVTKEPLLLKDEETCRKYLDRLRDGNLLVDGYSYESKYGEWFVFYKIKVLRLTGRYWTGEWV